MTATNLPPQSDLRRLENEAAEALRGRRYGQAAKAAETLVQINPGAVNAWVMLVYARRGLGDVPGMKAAAEHAAERAANNPNIGILLAEVLIQSGDVARARDRLLAEEPRVMADAVALSRISEAFVRCGEFADAERTATAACAAKPEDPALLFNLAAAQTATGNLEGAEASLDELVERQPHDYDAYYNRATLKRQTRDSNHIHQIEQRLAGAMKSPHGPVALNYALAKEREDLGEWAASFTALKQGADARRKLLSYDVAADVETMSQIASAFDAETCSGAPSPNDQDGPVFVLGLPRTGTTLVDRILAAHPSVESIGEVDDFPLALGAATQRVANKAERVAAAAKLDFVALGQDYETRARQRTGAGVFVDKTPSNFLYIGLIALALPQARIVHLKRHPMAAGYAIYKTLFRMGYPYSYDLRDLGRYIAAYQDLMAHWHAVLPGRIIEIEYETLAAHPEAQSRELIAACGLEWDDACLEFHTNNAPTATASAAQVREPVHTRSIDLWKHYQAELEPLRGAIADAGGDPQC